MFVQQLYTNCLAQAAYYVESNGEAAIIDPMRDTEQYIKLAESRGAKIKYVFETHFHADFVSGHLELARKTGAVIVYGPNAKPGYDALVALDHEKFKLGNTTIELLHTPGHTIESSCFLLNDEDNAPYCVFTGDTVFIGDVGRPDLMSGNLNKEQLADMLFDSINNKIKTLADHVILYPGHGAGSACGKSIGKETVSTIGQQKANNYALKENDRARFIAAVTSELPTPPAYFFKDAAINISGYDSLEVVMQKSLRALKVDDFKKEITAGALILDTRNAEVFGAEFIPGSINIGLNGDFAVWVGTLIDIATPIVLVCEMGKENESITRLSRIGFDNIKGYLEGGTAHWLVSGNICGNIPALQSTEIEKMLNSGNYELIDVRRKSEYDLCKIKNSKNIPLSEFNTHLNSFDKNKKYIISCAGGYRSMIAASMLRKHGIFGLCNVQGGINKFKEEVPELIDYAHV